MTQPSRRVVVTGAAGLIGRAITPLLPAGWDVLRTDIRAAAGIGALDVTDADACRTAFAGADAVVHLAVVPDPDASWERLLPANVVGAHQVSPGPRASAVSAASCSPAVCRVPATRVGWWMGAGGRER